MAITQTAPDLLPLEALERSASVLRVLAHAQRLRIVELLMDRKMSVGELADTLDLAPNAVCQHLNHMRAHGILDCRRDGRTAFYRVANPHACNVIRCIRRHASEMADG